MLLLLSKEQCWLSSLSRLPVAAPQTSWTTAASIDKLKGKNHFASAQSCQWEQDLILFWRSNSSAAKPP